MATATGVSIEAYLHTDYEPDCDYVDRNLGQRDHRYFQAALCAYLFGLRGRFGYHVFSGQRLRAGRTRFRIPDVCVVLGPCPDEQVFNRPPFLCIEMSSEDRMVRMQTRIREVTDGILRTSDPEIAVPLSEVLPQ